MTTIVNIKSGAKYDVYCGRPSIFGNPFVIGKDGSRDEVIEKYRTYFHEKISSDQNFLNEVYKLKDKTLGCFFFCVPQKCHCEVIVGYLDNNNFN